MNTLKKLFSGVEIVKLGKLRQNPKLRRIYNCWIVFGVDHCQKAMREIEHGKIPGMKLLKIGRTKDYKCGAITKKGANSSQKTSFYMLGGEASTDLQKVR